MVGGNREVVGFGSSTGRELQDCLDLVQGRQASCPCYPVANPKPAAASRPMWGMPTTPPQAPCATGPARIARRREVAALRPASTTTRPRRSPRSGKRPAMGARTSSNISSSESCSVPATRRATSWSAVRAALRLRMDSLSTFLECSKHTFAAELHQDLRGARVAGRPVARFLGVLR